MGNNLLKKEIDLISTEDLNIRYCFILDRAEKSKAEDIPIADAREILWIEDVLRSRLIRQLDRDPYPPDRVTEQQPSNYMKSLLKSRQDIRKVEKTLDALGPEISFQFEFFNSMKSKIGRTTIKAVDKGIAMMKAREHARSLGKNVTAEIG